MDMKQLALEIIEGRRLTRADDLSFFKNADLEELTEDDIIRTVAMFRFMNPTAYIRMAAGRNYFKDGGKRLFCSGVNAIITGDMLTTVGNNTKQDIEMLTEMGFDLSRRA